MIIPSLGAFCSQSGNDSFPAWEYLVAIRVKDCLADL